MEIIIKKFMSRIFPIIEPNILEGLFEAIHSSSTYKEYCVKYDALVNMA